MFKRIVIKSAGIPEFAAELQNYPTYDVEAMCTMGCFIIAVLRLPSSSTVVVNSVIAPPSPEVVAAKVVEEASRVPRKNRR